LNDCRCCTAEALQHLQSFNKMVCKGAAFRRYADECAQTQDISARLGGAIR
jgi:hypothetical protein